MISKGKKYEVLSLIRLEDEPSVDELLNSISASKVYQKNRKYLPEDALITYLYVKNNMKFGSDSHLKGAFFVQEVDIDMFMRDLIMRYEIDIYSLRTFIDSFHTNLVAIESTITFSKEQQTILLNMFLYVVENYWESRIFGGYEKTIDVAKLLTTFINLKPSREITATMKKTIDAAIKDNKGRYLSGNRSQSKGELIANKAEDITLTIDYSFGRNKHKATYKLASAGKSIRLSNLFKQNELDFLMNHVVNPLTLNCNKEIKPGSIATIEETVVKLWGKERPYHIDHINNAIRKYISSPRKIKCFSHRGRSIEVKICICLEQISVEDQFGKRKM